MKKIAIIGSTGSIGKQSLQVIDNLKDVKIIALSANENINLLTKQIIKYQPKYFHIHEKYAKKMVLKQNSKLKTNEEIAKIKEIDLFIIASTGISGLLPMILALKSGKQVAIANKESLVIGGPFIQEILNKHEKNGAKLLPIDSEHSAIWQCMVGEEWKSVKNIILTASGGSLLNKSNEQMKKITPKDALNHPNWNMGNKITIDSATLFNKGLEVIEASILFNLPLDKINAIIHRESIVHSIVNFNDGSSKAHLGIPDMRIPIQYALTYPERKMTNFPNNLSLSKIQKLSFEEIKNRQFPLFNLLIHAAKKSDGSLPAILGADDILVNAFLNKKIGFESIYKIIKKISPNFKPSNQFILDNVIGAYEWGKEFAMKEISNKK